jgi:biopolymer transport protein ExbB/TolQ
LLGTVTGLAGVFVSGATPDPSSLAAGFGLALSTTVIGLGIAIPAQFAANWLYRRIEIVADQLANLAATLSETDPAP